MANSSAQQVLAANNAGMVMTTSPMGSGLVSSLNKPPQGPPGPPTSVQQQAAQQAAAALALHGHVGGPGGPGPASHAAVAAALANGPAAQIMKRVQMPQVIFISHFFYIIN